MTIMIMIIVLIIMPIMPLSEATSTLPRGLKRLRSEAAALSEPPGLLMSQE